MSHRAPQTTGFLHLLLSYTVHFTGRLRSSEKLMLSVWAPSLRDQSFVLLDPEDVSTASNWNHSPDAKASRPRRLYHQQHCFDTLKVSHVLNQFNDYFVCWLRETVHSNPSSAKIKNGWSYTATTPISLHNSFTDNFYFRFKWNCLQRRSVLCKNTFPLDSAAEMTANLVRVQK